MNSTLINLIAPLKTSWQRLKQRLTQHPQVPAALLHDPDPATRWRAVRRLAGTPQIQHRDRLFELLADTDPIISDEAVRTLSSWGAKSTVQPALEALASQPALPVLLGLLDLLARAPDPAARPALTTYLAHTEPAVEIAATRALSALTRLEQSSDRRPSPSARPRQDGS